MFEVVIVVLPLMAFALAFAWRSPHRPAALSLWLAMGGGIYLARDRLAAGTHWVVLLQHVGINGALGLVFGRTLAPGAKPLISRLAEAVHGSLSARMERYTERATRAWTAFFATMVLTSLLLFAFAPLTLWSAFVNLLTFPLVLAMFAGEYLVRVLSLPAAERAGFFESIRAYRRLAAGQAKPH